MREISVDYTSEPTRLQKTTRDVASERAKRLTPEKFSQRLVYAMKGEKRYVRLYPDYIPAEGETSKAKSEKPDHFYVFDGIKTRDYQPLSGAGNLSEDKDVDFEDIAKEYFALANFPLTEERKRSSAYTATALSRVESYKVLPNLEMVDGHACHVVSSGDDTIWIDPECGYAMRRRVRFRLMNADEPGCLL